MGSKQREWGAASSASTQKGRDGRGVAMTSSEITLKPGQLIKPYVTRAMAAEMAERLYGFKALDIDEMVSYDDRNFHLKVAPDHRNPHVDAVCPHGYTLKVTNALKSADKDHFASVHSILTHLSGKGLRVPLPVRNISGSTWTMERCSLQQELPPDEEKRFGVHMLTFIPGVPVKTVEYTEDILYQWGQLLARCHAALQDFTGSPSLNEKNPFWNLKNFSKVADFVSVVKDEDHLQLVSEVLKCYHHEVLPSLRLLPKGIIHGDFNEGNILVTFATNQNASSVPGKRSGVFVDGILDLEDVHRAPYIWDVGVMLAYCSLDSHRMDPRIAMGHALAGYLAVRSLMPLEMLLLKACVASRLCQSLVLGAYSFSVDASNEYVLTSSSTGWSRLKQIWSTPNDELLHLWNEVIATYSLFIASNG